MSSKLINIILLAAIAILACSFSATPSNALSVDSQNVVRHIPRAHNAIAKRKRASGRRCKNRSSSSAQPTPTHSSNQKPKVKPQSNDGPSYNGPQGKGKFGLAWPNGPDSSLSDWKAATWLYTWSPHCPSNTDGIACYPMLWGSNQIGDFKSLVKKGYSNVVLGFNEPNQAGQSNMDPGTGISLWKTYIQPLKAQGYQLISPATSSAPSGKTWMTDFFNGCGGCTFDGTGLHYYDVDTVKFQAYVKDFYDSFKHPIWVTEYACQNFNGGKQCTRDETNTFHETMKKFFEDTSWVAHYSPFGVMHQMQGVNTFNQMMNGDGSPNALGQMYLH